MDARLRRILICPLCHAAYEWEIAESQGPEIIHAQARCPSCRIIARVQGGIGVFLPGDAPEHLPASWGQASGTVALQPALSPDWTRAVEAQTEWILDEVAGSDQTIIELYASASGISRGLLARGGSRPIVSGRDLSSMIDLKHRWRSAGVPDRWDGIIFEPHSMPFAHRSLGNAVAQLGLQELRGSHVVLRELRRVVSGRIFAIAAFLGPPGEVDHERSPESPSDPMYFEEPFLESFRRARWNPRFVPGAEVSIDPSVPPPGTAERGETFHPESDTMRIGVVIAE